MKVRDLIQKLQQFDPELPVCVADWSEQWNRPDEEVATGVELVEGAYSPDPPMKECPYHAVGKFVCIGCGVRS